MTAKPLDAGSWRRYVALQAYLVQNDPSERIVIVGGPRRGKSTIARWYRIKGLQVFCCDPQSMVKDPEPDVTYLPEGLDWSAGSQYVADHWLPMPGPHVIEGVATVRALRKWNRKELPADKIVVFPRQHPLAPPLLRGQKALALGVASVWSEIEPRFRSIVEYR